jgi:polysaccharide export outer membrane protein
MEHSHFSVMGEVKKPGNYEITGKVSLIEALSMAGGFTPIANKRTVKIIRSDIDGKQTLVVDTAKITESGEMSDDFYMHADDVLIVPKSFF